MSAVNNQGWINSMNAWLRVPGQGTKENIAALRAQGKELGIDPGAIGDGATEPPPGAPSAKAEFVPPPPQRKADDALPPTDDGDIDAIGPVAPKRSQKTTIVEPVAPPKALDGPAKTGDGGFSTEAQTTKKTPEETKAFATKLISHLQGELGISKNQAIGIVANLMHESAGLNPGMNQGMRIGEPSSNMADDNANGYGLAQWGGVRKQALIDLAAQQGIPASSEKANVDFLVKELKGEYSGVISELKTKKTVAEATESFCSNYEKPSDPQLQSRLDAASQIS